MKRISLNSHMIEFLDKEYFGLIMMTHKYPGFSEFRDMRHMFGIMTRIFRTRDFQ